MTRLPRELVAAALVLFAGFGLVATVRPAAAQTCECSRRTPEGHCYRWYDAEVPWSIWAPGETPTSIPNAAFEAAAQQAFAAWQSVTCTSCMAPTAAGCGPVPCPANPLGLAFRYDGFKAKATYASCVKDGKQTGPADKCPGTEKGSVQLALIRNEVDWPMGSKVVSAVIYTPLDRGRLIDADLVVRDNGYVYCLDKCNDAQYSLGAVLLREVGHLLNVGKTDNALSILAANFKPGTQLVAALDTAAADCACEIYRTTPFRQLCETPATEVEAQCMAVPLGQPRGRPLRAGGAGVLWTLGALGSIVWWQRRRVARQGNGTSSPAANRVA
ncbi:MAG: hypothetical protein EXR79_04670 [Myxococcales bacterium]|nr:hypothetical protein [Myxococcales bacterium]